MRIVKARAREALRSEVAGLARQSQRCESQANKLSRLYVGGMAGRSVTALEERYRMQAAVVLAHLAFYRALSQADRRNEQLVSALPTTSAGVLDTEVARERRARALRSLRDFERRRQEAVRRAQLINDAMSASGLAFGTVGPSQPLDLGEIRASYDALIAGQRAIAELNERILDKAEAYRHASAALYRGVDATLLQDVTASVLSYVQTGQWGSTTWVGRLYLGMAVTAETGRQQAAARRAELLRDQFLSGGIKVGEAAASDAVRCEGVLAGVPVAFGSSGSILAGTAYLRPMGLQSTTVKDDASTNATGVEAGARAGLYEGRMTVDVGLLSSEAGVDVLVGAVSGSVGASLYSKGELAPSAVVGVAAKGSVLCLEEGKRLGTTDFNAHVSGEARLLSGSAEAKVAAGLDGVEAKVGAEAYVAQGALSGGLTFLGVRLDVTIEGKAGGIGGKAGARVGTNSAEGELGVGLLVGLGAKAKLDWSGLYGALDTTGQAVETWWNELQAA